MAFGEGSPPVVMVAALILTGQDWCESWLHSSGSLKLVTFLPLSLSSLFCKMGLCPVPTPTRIDELRYVKCSALFLAESECSRSGSCYCAHGVSGWECEP